MSCLATSEHLACTSCELHQYRQRVVPGHGDPHARIMLVGEAPGAAEDREGQPFVGPAGKRLDRILERVGLARESLWISNVAKCRPPDNNLRAYPNSTIVCPSLWLAGEIDTVRPRVLVSMGAIASARWFPGLRPSETADLNRALEGGMLTVISAFHPSYALRMGGVYNAVDESIASSLRRAMEVSRNG